LFKTKPKTTPYDVVEYFRDETDMLAYIDAALEDGDASIIARQCGLGRESPPTDQRDRACGVQAVS